MAEKWCTALTCNSITIIMIMIYKYCPLHPVVCLMHIKYEKYVHFENIEHIENIKHIKGVYLVSGESEQVDNDRE